jgi:peptidoglycan hydrolase CwlO-like protein
MAEWIQIAISGITGVLTGGGLFRLIFLRSERKQKTIQVVDDKVKTMNNMVNSFMEMIEVLKNRIAALVDENMEVQKAFDELMQENRQLKEELLELKNKIKQINK